MGNTYFGHRSLHKYKRVASCQDGVEVKDMIDIVLVKKDMLHYRRDVRSVRGMGRGLSDNGVVLCKVRSVGTWIKRREVMVWARRIRSEKLREHQYKEGYARSFEGKGIEWDEDNKVERLWEQVKLATVKSAR